jgi:hypothetical protein
LSALPQAFAAASEPADAGARSSYGGPSTQFGTATAKAGSGWCGTPSLAGLNGTARPHATMARFFWNPADAAALFIAEGACPSTISQCAFAQCASPSALRIEQGRVLAPARLPLSPASAGLFLATIRRDGRCADDGNLPSPSDPLAPPPRWRGVFLGTSRTAGRIRCFSAACIRFAAFLS